jgi:hypothetical protein
MNAKNFLGGLAGLVVFLVVFHCANGQVADYGFPPVSPYWGYAFGSTCGSDIPPYFSLHPPVYYSYRVARTYGYSPFPYPPYVLTPGSEPPRQVTVQNVYGQADQGQVSEATQSTPPLRIDNPYVEKSDKSARDSKGVRHPQVVYPALLARRAK